MIIKTKLITLNRYIGIERANKHFAAKVKKRLTNCIALECANYKKVEGLNDVEIIWKKPDNRTDHDNISFCKKFIFDGLKQAGIIKDDSPKYIRNFKETFILDRRLTGIECDITFKKV